MSSLIGAPAAFDARNQRWSSYQTQFEHFLLMNAIADDKKVSCLIALMGSDAYETLESLTFPDKPATKDINALFALLRNHFEPKRLKISEQYHFWKCKQGSSQSMADFMSTLRKLASTCEFPADYLPDALCTAFVLGLRDEHVSRRLLSEENLTTDKALTTAQGMETANKESHVINSNGPSSHVDAVGRHFKGSRAPQRPGNQKPPPGPCSRCNSTDHWRANCPFKDATCHSCGNVGHLAKVCRSKQPSSGKTKFRPKTTTNHRAHTVEQTASVLSLHDKDSSRGAVIVSTRIDGKFVQLQLDTGATATLLNEATWIRIGKPALRPSDLKLQSYTETDIPTLGTVDVKVECHSKAATLPAIVVPGDRRNLFGRPWIDGLQLDLNHVYHVNQIKLQKPVNNSPKMSQPFPTELQKVLDNHPRVFQEGLGSCTKVKVHLSLKPDAQPKFCKPRPLPFALKPAVEAEIDRLVACGIWEPVEHSKWATPLVVVPKPGNAVRICGDFSVTLNPQLNINQYPLPRPEELFAALNGGQKFTKIDMKEAYHQLMLDDESKDLVVYNTHKGLFRSTRLAFGLASAPAIFQQTMDTMLQGIDHEACYIDDVIATGADDGVHLQTLDAVLQRFEDYDFRLRREKCYFMQPSVEYLAHVIDKDGIRVSPSKVAAIAKMPEPGNESQLRSVLGMITHYGKFIPRLYDLCAPLYRLLQKKTQWTWPQECSFAFKKVIKVLTSADALAHFDPAVPLFLAADASCDGIGAVLFHRYADGSEKAIAHASKTLTAAEKNYSQIEREGLALVYGAKKFHQFLFGRRFTMQTDHQPLTTIFGNKKGIPVITAGRLQRWALILMAYSYDIEYKNTKQFGNADGLSRLPVGPDTAFDGATVDVVEILTQQQLDNLPITASEIAAATGKDPVLCKVKDFVLQGWPQKMEDDQLVPYFRRSTELSTHNGCILWGQRVIIPVALRDEVLDLLHEAHPGKVRMKMLARAHIWWAKLDTDIEHLVDRCAGCAEVANNPAKVPLQQWNTPKKPWERLHIDYAGPFQGSMWLIIIDAYSKWPVVIQTNDTTSGKTIEMLLDTFCTHGQCEVIVSDNGPQFTSDEFDVFCKQRGIKHVKTAPYHPQSNGEAERFVQTFKSAINKAKQGGATVKLALRNFLIRYRVTPHATTGTPPCELLMRRHLRTNLDLLHPSSEPEKSVAHREKQKQQFDLHTKFRSFTIGSEVWARNFRRGPKWMKGIVTAAIGNVHYKVEVNQAQWKRHANQLRSRDDSWQPYADFTPPAQAPVPGAQLQLAPPQQPVAVQPRYPQRRRIPVQRMGL